MSEVPNRILLCPHMLCQPLFRRFCFVALITIKLQILCSLSEYRNPRNLDCIPQFFSIFSILSRFSFLYWLSGSFIDIHFFFKSVTNLHSYSGCSSPLPLPQSSSACSPPCALVTSVNWFMGAVPIHWGYLTSIDLKHFPHMSQLKVTHWFFSILSIQKVFWLQISSPSSSSPPGALVAPANWFRSGGIRDRYFPNFSHLRYFFITVLVAILKFFAASHLETTASFSTVHGSMSEEEYSSVVGSSASSAQVVIKISTDQI